MIKIRIILNNYLILKKRSKFIEIKLDQPVNIEKLLGITDINFSNIGFIKVDNLIVDKSFVISKSCELKLFPVIAGG
jgi:hypothetical protein